MWTPCAIYATALAAAATSFTNAIRVAIFIGCKHKRWTAGTARANIFNKSAVSFLYGNIYSACAWWIFIAEHCSRDWPVVCCLCLCLRSKLGWFSIILSILWPSNTHVWIDQICSWNANASTPFATTIATCWLYIECVNIFMCEIYDRPISNSMLYSHQYLKYIMDCWGIHFQIAIIPFLEVLVSMLINFVSKQKAIHSQSTYVLLKLRQCG